MLTTAKIHNAKPACSRYELSDGRGLVLRINPTGVRTWAVYLYHDGGKSRVTLGRYPQIGIRAARAQRERIRATKDRRDEIRMLGLAERYIADARARKRSWDRDETVIRRQILPTRVHAGRWVERLADVAVVDVTREHVFAVSDPIVERGASEQAARVHAVLRALLAFAVRRGVIVTNPAAAAGIRQGPPRARILTLDEIERWWAQLEAGASREAFIALGLVMATAARVTEVVTIEQVDLDEMGRTWLIPAEKSKNGITHAVPISSLAREFIDMARRQWPDSRRLLPVSADTVRRHCRAAIEAAGLRRTTPHDCRRTVATELARAGTERAVVDLILGHVDRSVGAVYDRYPRHAEQRQALEDWGERFRSIVNGGPRGQAYNHGPYRHPDLTPPSEETQAGPGHEPNATNHEG